VTDQTFGPYPAEIVAIHDGDTMTLNVDLGFDHIISGLDLDGKTRMACRVFGINAPELSTVAGKAALAYAQTLIKVGDRVTVVSHGWDKYGGRFDGAVTLASGASYGDAMIAAGQAVFWDGTGAKPVPT
jgi:endonuclease YncB( thermonuclease family)